MFNKVFLLGYLGKDPEISFINKDNKMESTTVVNFPLATNYFVKGEPVTQWHKIVAWNKVAENCAKYIKKGSQVFIEGRIQYDNWEDSEGNPRNATKIFVERIQFLNNPSKKNSETKDQKEFEDDIPF